MHATQTPTDFLAFTAQQVDGLTVNAKKAIQAALVDAPLEVCAWAQGNLDHWIELARDSLHRNISLDDARQVACDIVHYLCKHYHLPTPSE